MPDLKQVFAYWQEVVGDKGDPWQNEDDTRFMFDSMPRTDECLEKICAGHPHGEEVLQRLRRFFRDAAASSDDICGLPFTQSRLPRKSDEEIRALLWQHAANLRLMAWLSADDPHDPASDELVAWVGNPPELTRLDEIHDADVDHDLDICMRIEIPDRFNDRVAKADYSENPLWHLTEALYHSAWNCYHVPDYVLWPLKKGSSTLADPYLPKYELWLQGVTFCYTGNGRLAYTVDEV